jgi:hypothetical protein
VLVDRGLKGLVDFAEPVLENLGKTDKNGKIDAAEHKPIDELLQIDRATGVFCRQNADVPLVVDREVSVAPAGDVVKVRRIGGGPTFDLEIKHQGSRHGGRPGLVQDSGGTPRIGVASCSTTPFLGVPPRCYRMQRKRLILQLSP